MMKKKTVARKATATEGLKHLGSSQAKVLRLLALKEAQVNRITSLALAFLMAVGAATMSAAPQTCTLHPKTGATREELAAMAKVTQADAQKTALATLKEPSKATVKSAELEAEHGCLMYSFDIAVAGKTGVQEVQIDAGDGKVLSTKHESPKAEAAEKARDKARAQKN